ncbi:MAG: hypothetical protein H0U67_03320 [Gemmatimonadetes bacterium]|nr:hypothetical protein [Gemmatimonadota bacterium]
MTRRVRLPGGLATCVLFLSALPLASQSAPRAEKAQVLVLGTYHFANPGLDVVKTEVADVLTAAKQAEIRALVEEIARFRPTRVAVEHVPASADRLDSLYSAFRSGRYELGRDETEQLGFRLAARFEHERVHPIDVRGEFPFGPVMEYAAAKDTASLRLIQVEIARISAEDSRVQRELTVGEILRHINDPALLAHGHGIYVRVARVGAGDTYVGADLLSKWYDRNIRIAANIQQLARPGDRVLVIIGGGHAPILRDLIMADPELSLVDPLQYLP